MAVSVARVLKTLHHSLKWALLACFCCGLLSAAALPPLSWPLFYFLGFAGFATLLRGAPNLKRSFAYACCYAVGFHLAGLYWISASLFVDIQRYFWVLPFSLLALPCYLALLFGLGAISVHNLRGKPILHAFALSVALLIYEVARGILLSGFPWNLFGYIWADTLPVIQITSIIGIHGLTWLTLLAGSCFSLLLLPPSRWHWMAIAIIGMIFSGIALWGMNRLETTHIGNVPDVAIRIVQPVILQSERKTYEQRLLMLKRLIDLSQQPAKNPITHIFWAETASPFYLNEDAEARNILKHIVPHGGALLTGSASRIVENNNKRYYNSLVVMNDKGNVVGNYDKSHLVPFGEFIPLRNILQTVPIAADVIGSADFSSGSGPKTIRATGLPSFSAMICYEAIFSGHIVNEADRPQMLVQITNDAWFGDTSGPYQHLAMARVRAIEEGLPLVRVANSGISAIIDPLGRIAESLPLNQRGILDGKIPQALPPTSFAKLLN